VEDGAGAGQIHIVKIHALKTANPVKRQFLKAANPGSPVSGSGQGRV